MKYIKQHPKPSKNYNIFVQRDENENIVRAYCDYIGYIHAPEKIGVYREFDHKVHKYTLEIEYPTDWTCCEQETQFIFEACLKPVAIYHGRSAAAIYWKDVDDVDSDNQYYMTLSAAFDLFKEAIAGNLKLRDGGIVGIFTIVKRGQNYIIEPYTE